MIPEEQEEWTLVACTTCGSLVREKVNEDGTPTYKPLLERASETEPLRSAVMYYRPVFSGKTNDDTKITLYKHAEREDELWISLDEGELLPLGAAEVYTGFDLDTQLFHIQINSRVWSGMAKGNRWDLMKAQGR